MLNENEKTEHERYFLTKPLCLTLFLKNPLGGIRDLAVINTGLMERDLLKWISEDLNFT